MTSGSRGLGKISIAALALVALTAWLVNTVRSSGPYAVNAAELSGWTLVAGTPGEPGIVALEPPRRLAEKLFQDLAARTGQPLVAPARTLVPLVLQSEYEDSLQGVLSADDVMRVARESGIDAARFDPVCVAQRGRPAPEQRQVFFVIFDSPGFADFRQRLLPLHTEHGGARIYDPTALRPIMVVAATDREFGRWWPLSAEPWDCRIPLEVSGESPD